MPAGTPVPGCKLSDLKGVWVQKSRSLGAAGTSMWAGTLLLARFRTQCTLF